MKIRLLSMIIVFNVLLGIGLPAMAHTEGHLFINRPEAVIDNETFVLEVPPRIWDGTTMLPLRFVAEKILEANLTWEQRTQAITIVKDDILVQLKLNEPQALVNGKSIPLTMAPITEKDRTLVPVRFLAETFGYEVHYHDVDQSILFRKAQPPVAYFHLSQERIIAGQTIWAEEHSYDPYGYPIIDRVWQINRNPQLRSNNLASIFAKPPAGEYVVELRVKNRAGVWSDWAEQTLVVEPNQPPVIKEFRHLSPKVHQGENINFIYQVDNEPWEEIVEERWSYRHLDSDLSGMGKPRALFAPGPYEISLQVRDAYGNWSEPISTDLEVSHITYRQELEYKLANPIPGELIDNPSRTNYNNFIPEENYRTWTGGPTLLLSNSPEAVLTPGILYRDEVSGAFRVMYHHKNSTPAVRQLVVVAENQGDQPITLIQSKSAASGPVADVMHLGQLVALNYLQAPTQAKSLVIQPGQKLVLYQSPDTGWKQGQSLTGMFDLKSDGPLSITIAALGIINSLEELDCLPMLPRDLHARGTFPNADRWVEISISADEPRKVEIGKDQQGYEQWLEGYDALTGTPIIHKGNYGAIYYLTFYAPTRTGILLNPRGLTFKGAFRGFDGNSYKAPAQDGFYGSRRAAVIGVLEGGQSSTLIYTPPNGSDAPIIIGLVPETYWTEL